MASTDYSDDRTPTARDRAGPAGGESAWESPAKVDGGFQPMYGYPGSYGEVTFGNGPLPGSVTYDRSGSRSITGSPASNAATDSSYPRSIPIPRSMQSMPIHPPSPADGGISPSSLESGSSRYVTPPLNSFNENRVSGNARVLKTPRARRRNPRNLNRTIDDGMCPDLSGPLSELTQHMSHIPIRDMEAFVNRPLETRLHDISPRGKVKRPMNSFMLYRSAYTERIKALFQQNNHQGVSKGAGKSWEVETPEIREKYTRLANIEKNNHKMAHPDYKFAPAGKREDSPKPKNKRCAEDEGSSDLDDPDFIPSSLPPYAKRSRDSSYDSRASAPYDEAAHSMPTTYFSSVWDTTRPVAGLTSSPENMYLQPTIHPSPMGSQIEDVRFRRVDVPDMHYTSGNVLTGLPGGAHELLQTPTSVGPPTSGQLDPRLLMLESDEMVGNHAFAPTQQAHLECASPTSYISNTLSPSPTPYRMATSGSFQSSIPSLAEHRASLTGHRQDNFEVAGGEFDDRWYDPRSPGY